MLYPEQFLRQLDQQRNKIIYAKITSLSFDEHPLEEIEGRITSGSINVDGSSAVRTTCQISMVTDKVDIANYLWGINTKFKLSIGVENLIDKNYPDIIWFDKGIFVISSFSSALNTNSYTINISGKDKMCLLNGEAGGNINSSTDFGTIEQEIKNVGWKKIKLPVQNIIREMVHAYAGEPFHNIIINDLETVGLTLQNYNCSQPMYLLRKNDGDEYIQGFVNQNQKVMWGDSVTTLGELEQQGFVFESLLDDFLETQTKYSTVKWPSDSEAEEYVIAKIDYGETAGYTETELVYPDELIANIGETITSVLDKIKNFLGEFEYFYNAYGQFVFQKKKIYVQNVFSPVASDGESTYTTDVSKTDLAYTFSGSEFFTAFNNTPNLANVKNDYTVWGTKGSTKVPIHMRYAIDKKPVIYKTIAVTDDELINYNILHGLELKGQRSQLFIVGEKYKPTNQKVEEEQKPFVLRRSMPVATTEAGTLYYDPEKQLLLLKLNGQLDNNQILTLQTSGEYNAEDKILTIAAESYEICDWRELIYRMALDYSKYNHLDNFSFKIAEANPLSYPSGRTGYEQYYTDLQGFWRQLYNPFDGDPDTYYQEDSGPLKGWAKMIYEQPEQLLFWFDFLDTDGELAKFSVPVIGARTKVSNDQQVRAIVYENIPNIIFQSNTTGTGTNTAYRYFNTHDMSLFRKSARGKSAKEEIENLLYNHSYCIESVSITSIPIYYLDANTRIYIHDEESGIDGDYIVSKISLPLTYNGTMNITATKAEQKLL